MFKALLTLIVIALVFWGGVELVRFVQRWRRRARGSRPYTGGGSGVDDSRYTGPRKS